MNLIVIITLIVAAAPISLFLIQVFNGLIKQQHPATTAIYTNLVGTLTKPELQIRTLLFDDHKATVKENNLITLENTETKESILLQKKQMQKDSAMNLIALVTALCHYHKLKKIEDSITAFLKECKFNIEKYHHQYQTIQKISGDPKISTIIVVRNQDSDIFALSKGHPLTLLKHCSRIHINDEKKDLDHSYRRKIRKTIKKLNKNGQKVIAFAYKGLPKKRLDTYPADFAENDLVFLGLVALEHPINWGLQEDITAANEAGIKIFIATSAKERKAESVAKNLEIINPQHFETITGKYLSSISDQKLQKIMSKPDRDLIFAELNEEQKEQILLALHKEHPHLAISSKKHNISSIITNIKRSRLIKENQQKVVFHSLTCKIAELLLLITALILKAPLALSISLILIIEICINFILELALRLEPSPHNLMTSKYNPRKRKISLLHTIGSGLIVAAIITVLYLWNLLRNGWNLGDTLNTQDLISSQSTTMVFILLAIIQIFNALNIRQPHKSIFTTGLLTNPYALLSTIISALFLYLFMHFPYFQETLHLTPLSSIEWQIIATLSLIIIATEELRKIFTPSPPQHETTNL